MSSAGRTIYILVLEHTTLESHLLRGEFNVFAVATASRYNQAFFYHVPIATGLTERTWNEMFAQYMDA